MNNARWRRTALALVLAGGAAGAVALALGGSSNSQAADPLSTPTRADRIIAAPGVVEPATEEREIAAEITGVLGEVLVDENDEVKGGQVLAVIKNGELTARLAGAKAEVALREAELLRLKNGARAQERAAVAAALSEARTSWTWAKAEFERHRSLKQKGHVSEASYEDARRAEEASVAKVRAAEANLSLIEAPAREDEVARAQAAVDLAKANVAEVEAFLNKTFIKSPVEGTILRRFKEQGETVANQPPTLIFTVGDLSRLRVRAEIDEADIAKIKKGQRVYVTADAFPGEKFAGNVVRVANRLGAKTVLTERPSEKTDTKILETMIELDANVHLPVGLRVDVFVGDSES